jgi:hypothetical protein
MDDGRCHICRRVPHRESELYGITTCVDCDESRPLELHCRAIITAALLTPFVMAGVVVAILLLALAVQAISG